MSDGFVSGLITVFIVSARSFADIPVVTPRLASIDTVNAVVNFEVLWETIIGISSSQSLPFKRKQTNRVHASP
jgi:hypothetical protein